MDSFELNKILGALLGTCLILLSLNLVAGALFAPPQMAKPGYEIAVPEKDGAPAEAPTKEAEPSIAVLLASANVKQGETAAKKCAACHTFNKGGPNRVGPNLWGIVGREHASEAGFNYSAAMKKMTGKWSFEELNAFLKNPKGMVPGTNMSFAGLSRASERANVIAYLNTLSDNPLPLPKEAAAPPAPAAPKEATAPATSAPAPAKPAPAAPAPAAKPAEPAPPAPKAAETKPAPAATPAPPPAAAPAPAAPAPAAPAAAPPAAAPSAPAPSAPAPAAPAETKPPQ